MENIEKSLLDLEQKEFAKHCQRYKDKEFLDWLADRLENVYKENPNTDFIVKLRKIANNYLEDK